MKQLVLVGGGHAHVEIIRRWVSRPLTGVSLTVVDPNPRPVYSGMVPGFVAGEYRRDELEIDLRNLCRAAGAVFVADHAKAIDARAARIHCGANSALRYDVASIDIGSTVAGTELSGVREHAIASRPIPTLVSSVGQLIRRAHANQPRSFVVHVVGGGAGGVELAFCLEARLHREGVAATVAIVSRDARILSGGTPALSRAVMRAAAERGVRLILDAHVAELDRSGVVLETGERLATDAVLWVTGPAAHSLGADSSLPVDSRGFIETTDSLQVEGHESLFAAGDCASLPGMKRAGVYAVRSAPLLDHNLRARFEGGAPRSYRPQRDFLSLLNLGDGTAIATKWGLVTTGRTVLRVKDWIDRSFMEKYK